MSIVLSRGCTAVLDCVRKASTASVDRATAPTGGARPERRRGVSTRLFVMVSTSIMHIRTQKYECRIVIGGSARLCETRKNLGRVSRSSRNRVSVRLGRKGKGTLSKEAYGRVFRRNGHVDLDCVENMSSISCSISCYRAISHGMLMHPVQFV